MSPTARPTLRSRGATASKTSPSSVRPNSSRSSGPRARSSARARPRSPPRRSHRRRLPLPRRRWIPSGPLRRRRPPQRGPPRRRPPANSSMTGLFITLEGGDGAGKSTQAELLSGWLEAQGREVVRTREPGGTELGAALRQLLLHGSDIAPRAEALLYAADRAQHVAEVVRPALERGAVVVQDRYIDSSLAYQGAARALETAEIRRLSEWASGELWPDATVLLDVSPELAVERRKAAGGQADRLESEAAEVHRAVREGFLSLAAADGERFLVLDAARPADELHAAIRARVQPLLAG